MVFFTCAAIICMIRPFGPLESSGCAQPSSILFSLYPFTGNSLSLVPLGMSYPCVGSMCSEFQQICSRPLGNRSDSQRSSHFWNLWPPHFISNHSDQCVSSPKSGSDDFILIWYYV